MGLILDWFEQKNLEILFFSTIPCHDFVFAIIYFRVNKKDIHRCCYKHPLTQSRKVVAERSCKSKLLFKILFQTSKTGVVVLVYEDFVIFVSVVHWFRRGVNKSLVVVSSSQFKFSFLHYSFSNRTQINPSLSEIVAFHRERSWQWRRCSS